ncbi:MAG TPA: 3-hydroxyacyl-CoA dehydrogenase family protein, partial [Longimicrobiaceae bacterium]|nr:3-hydroxyacyl-CoA dehydrogenase family protein [Longimicrobiaceae bacterium]
LLDGLADALGERFRPDEVLGRTLAVGSRFRDARRATPARAGEEREVVRDRVELLVLNEAVRALEEGVGGAAEVEIASLLGVGWPRARGGILYAADRAGLATQVRRLETLAGHLGERFEPASLLQRLANKGEGFFSPSGQPATRVL